MIKGDKEISEEKVSEFKSAFREKDKDNDNRVDVSVTLS